MDEDPDHDLGSTERSDPTETLADPVREPGPSRTGPTCRAATNIACPPRYRVLDGVVRIGATRPVARRHATVERRLRLQSRDRHRDVWSRCHGSHRKPPVNPRDRPEPPR